MFNIYLHAWNSLNARMTHYASVVNDVARLLTQCLCCVYVAADCSVSIRIFRGSSGCLRNSRPCFVCVCVLKCVVCVFRYFWEVSAAVRAGLHHQISGPVHLLHLHLQHRHEGKHCVPHHGGNRAVQIIIMTKSNNYYIKKYKLWDTKS